MGHARDLHKDQATHARPSINLVFPSNSLAVRKALKSVQDGLRYLGLNDEEKGVVEIVLAETLNNIVEHAYAGRENGVIELNLHTAEQMLRVEVCDDGHPMPNNALPEGAVHNLDVSEHELPEGGFGWFLIRELTSELHYERRQSSNCLSYIIPRNGEMALQ